MKAAPHYFQAGLSTEILWLLSGYFKKVTYFNIIIILFLFFSRNQSYDIYHDSNLKEISQVLPVLSRFLSRLQQLLQEWPEHPTLVQVNQSFVENSNLKITEFMFIGSFRLKSYNITLE